MLDASPVSGAIVVGAVDVIGAEVPDSSGPVTVAGSFVFGSTQRLDRHTRPASHMPSKHGLVSTPASPVVSLAAGSPTSVPPHASTPTTMDTMHPPILTAYLLAICVASIAV